MAPSLHERLGDRSYDSLLGAFVYGDASSSLDLRGPSFDAFALAAGGYPQIDPIHPQGTFRPDVG